MSAAQQRRGRSWRARKRNRARERSVFDVEEQAPLRQQHILQADPGGAATLAGEQMYAQWKSARGETLARASHPSITVQTVTSLAGAETVDQRIQVEIDAAGAAVAAALVHPIMRMAAAGARAGRVRREAPVLLQREDSALVEGVVDLAIRQENSDFNGWAVVDFLGHSAKEVRRSFWRRVGAPGAGWSFHGCKSAPVRRLGAHIEADGPTVFAHA